MNSIWPKILVVDDDADLLAALKFSLREVGEVVTATSVNSGLEVLRKSDTDVVVVDLEFDGQEHDGLFLLAHVSRLYPNLPIVVFSGDSNTKRIVDATRYHLTEFVTKGENDEALLITAVTKALSLRRMSLLQESKASVFETRSPKMLQILADLNKVLSHASHAPILITGETGSGKEVMAKHIATGLRRKLVAANIASVPISMAESELFGHKRGAFTTALADRKGLIEEANGGICFLDEIGECPLELQAKLLRVLEQGELTPLGETRPRKVDVRFVSATNRSLDEMVRSGTFRFDLLQRLNTFTVNLLPLRERPEDILLYATKFMEQCSPNIRYFLSPAAISVLMEYTWPGNVRELRNVIERVLVISPSRNIQADDVQKALSLGVSVGSQGFDSKPFPKASSVYFSEEDIIRTLKETNGNRQHAAERMGVHRATLFRWLKMYGLSSAVVGKVGRPGLVRSTNMKPFENGLV